MMDFSIPLQGMSAAEASLNRTAKAISGIGAQSPSAPGGASTAAGQGDSIDLSAQMIALMVARDGFAANVNVAKTMDQMTKATLNLLG